MATLWESMSKESQDSTITNNSNDAVLVEALGELPKFSGGWFSSNEYSTPT